jgi:tyrosyl-tRNA synthetase
MLRAAIAPSKSEARRLVQSGGVYVNNRRMNDVQMRLKAEHAIAGELLLLRKGARETRLIRLT